MKMFLYTTLFMLSLFSTISYSAPNIASNDISTQSFGQTKSDSQRKCKISVGINSFYDKDVIENDLKQKDGVYDIYLDLDEKIAYVTYDSSITNTEKLNKLINDLGYSAKVIEDPSN